MKIGHNYTLLFVRRRFEKAQKASHSLYRETYFLVEVVAKPHKHFFNVTMTQASWKKATNILI